MENDTFKGSFDLRFKRSKHLSKYCVFWKSTVAYDIAVSAMSAQQLHCVACTRLDLAQSWNNVEALSA